MNELLLNFVNSLIIITCSHKITLKRLSDFCIRKNKLIVGVAIFVIFGFAFNFYQMKEKGIIITEVYVQMVFFILIFMFVIYEWQKSRVDAEKRKAQLEMNQLYYDAYDRLIMLIRERQHDIKNHINAILSMIYTTDSYDELAAKQREYCGCIMEQNEKTRLVLSAENPLIAGFIYSKVQEAEKSNIKVEYQIEIKKETSIIPEYELVEMAGVLIDNAIEALSNMGQNASGDNFVKRIYVSMKETEVQVEIVIANTSNYYEEDMTERFFEAGYSSKGNGRGIGLSKLKSMVNERNGEIIVSNEDIDGRNYLMFTIKISKLK
ncbi:MAG: GHKL domain-containing protein [Lachnospiraceae bacterium]|nr:GHKL domain-containing protein [Lachnospiraceae bacterium]